MSKITIPITLYAEDTLEFTHQALDGEAGDYDYGTDCEKAAESFFEWASNSVSYRFFEALKKLFVDYNRDNGVFEELAAEEKKDTPTVRIEIVVKQE